MPAIFSDKKLLKKLDTYNPQRALLNIPYSLSETAKLAVININSFETNLTATYSDVVSSLFFNNITTINHSATLKPHTHANIKHKRAKKQKTTSSTNA